MIADRYRETILDGLREALAGETRLRAILRYHIGMSDADGNPSEAYGKLLRPAIVLAVAEGLGGDIAVAREAALALELVHNFSLIHDDIQDRDEVRRGRATVWAIHGIAEAINAGDLMLTIAMAHGVAAGPAHATALLEAVDRMIEGQSLDLQFERRSVTVDEYLAMVDRKTGALLSCAFQLGGLAAGVGDDVLEQLAGLGGSIGRGFQIQDDLLGIWGVGDVVGKPQGSDIRRRKKSFPIAAAHAEVSGDDAARLGAIYNAQGDEGVPDQDVAWVIELLNRQGVRAQGQRNVDEHFEAALRTIGELPLDSSIAEDLRSLIAGLRGREK